MVFLVLGVATLAVFMMALGMFSRAQVDSIKTFGVWLVAFAGLSLATLMFFTGKGEAAIAALALFGPLVWSWMGKPRPKMGQGGRSPARPGAMTRAEALQVLGLPDRASEAEIRDAHRRLMQGAHPDHGGSDWLAARINQARDVLLG
jgi:DnaJ family protein C protein 19